MWYIRRLDAPSDFVRRMFRKRSFPYLDRVLRRVTLLVAAALVFPAGYSHGQANSEAQLKAAYLVNFLRYVEWPAQASSASICLFGRDTLGPSLASYEGRSVAGRELHVRRVTGREQMADCRILFIPDTEEARYGAILAWTERLPVLTVGDGDAFIAQGGGIGLVRSDGRLQFDINLDTLNRQGLKPGFQMLRLARKVMGAPK